MTQSHDDRTHTDLLDSMDRVLTDTVPQVQTRRRLVTRASGLLAAGVAMSVPGVASAAPRKGNDDSILSVLSTFEAFGVTLLSVAVQRSPGTPSAAFAGVVKAAATTEFFHLQALRKLGGAPLTDKFWIPNAVLDGGAGLFNAIAAQEEVEISAYLAGVTNATQNRDAKSARLFAEALGTEAEHRVLARFASATIRGTTATEIPNNRAFEAYPVKTPHAALKASEAAGIGYGKQSGLPGAFYTYPGNPLTIGTGVDVLTHRPA